MIKVQQFFTLVSVNKKLTISIDQPNKIDPQLVSSLYDRMMSSLAAH
jgi:hypothetical protein